MLTFWHRQGCKFLVWQCGHKRVFIETHFLFSLPLRRSSLKSVRTELLQQLQNLQGAPSVQMQQVPPPYERVVENNDDDPDEKGDGNTNKKRKTNSAELYDKVD